MSIELFWTKLECGDKNQFSSFSLVMQHAASDTTTIYLIRFAKN
jgi:hypothetical protein